jgi:hypothetical protein
MQFSQRSRSFHSIEMELPGLTIHLSLAYASHHTFDTDVHIPLTHWKLPGYWMAVPCNNVSALEVGDDLGTSIGRANDAAK